MAFSNYLENAVLNNVLGQAAMPTIGMVYIAAYTATPTDAGGGTEVSAGGYARVALTNNTTNFPTTTTSEKNLGATASFPEATVNWGTVTAIGILDASSGGNLLMWCAITPQIINANDVLRIPLGTAGLRVTLE